MNAKRQLLRALKTIAHDVQFADQRPWYVSIKDWEHETGHTVPVLRICALVSEQSPDQIILTKINYELWKLFRLHTQTTSTSYPVAYDAYAPDGSTHCLSATHSSWFHRWSKWTREGRNRRKLLAAMIETLENDDAVRGGN